MSLAPGRHFKYSTKKFCSKCKRTTDQICSRVSSRQSENSEDLDVLTRVWSCLVCGYGYDQVVEVPMPTEGGMIFKRLLKVTDERPSRHSGRWALPIWTWTYHSHNRETRRESIYQRFRTWPVAQGWLDANIRPRKVSETSIVAKDERRDSRTTLQDQTIPTITE